MATPADIAEVRRMTGEVGSGVYTDEIIGAYVDDAATLGQAAARIWGEKASSYADLVNMSEAGSSRNNSDLFKHAKEQQAYYEDFGGTVVPDSGDYSTTRGIVRP